MISNELPLVHHFLEASANSFPNKYALIHENIKATYNEINFNAKEAAIFHIFL